MIYFSHIKQKNQFNYLKFTFELGCICSCHPRKHFEICRKSRYTSTFYVLMTNFIENDIIYLVCKKDK